MLYVAYGSNMNLEQMAYRCPKSTVVGNGKIKGWKLVFNVHADIIKGKKSDEVPVVVWDIHKDDWKKLDVYEGYPTYYIRENINVKMDDGKSVDAIVYVMTKNRKGIYPPFKDYFRVCEIGYIENGIDTRPLNEALEYSFLHQTKHNQYSPR